MGPGEGLPKMPLHVAEAISISYFYLLFSPTLEAGKHLGRAAYLHFPAAQ